MYNFGSSTVNPVTLMELLDFAYVDGPSIGSEKIVWYPFMVFYANKFLFMFFHILLHFIPAVFADTALFLMRKKPR